MSDTKTNIFVVHLRRVLYLSQILQYNLDALKECEVCPSYLKMASKGINNSINRLKSDLAYQHPQRWGDTKNELLGDKVHDLSMLLDAMQGVDNIDEITAVIVAQKEML